MTIVVKLGGTNGSGKTAVARALLEKMKSYYKITNPLHENKVFGYCGRIERKKWAILGSYANICGGMDTISDKNLRLRLVREAAKESNAEVVFFEGLITGKTYGAFGAMSEEPEHTGRWIYAFMDTPFDVCVQRVMQRRTAAAKAKGIPCCASFNPERTMRPTYKSVLATAKRAAAQGHTVVWLDHTCTPQQIATELVNVVERFSDARK